VPPDALTVAGVGVTAAVLPLFLAGSVMVVGLVLIVIAASKGRDYASVSATEPTS